MDIKIKLNKATKVVTLKFSASGAGVGTLNAVRRFDEEGAFLDDLDIRECGVAIFGITEEASSLVGRTLYVVFKASSLVEKAELIGLLLDVYEDGKKQKRLRGDRALLESVETLTIKMLIEFERK